MGRIVGAGGKVAGKSACNCVRVCGLCGARFKGAGMAGGRGHGTATKAGVLVHPMSDINSDWINRNLFICVHYPLHS